MKIIKDEVYYTDEEWAEIEAHEAQAANDWHENKAADVLEQLKRNWETEAQEDWGDDEPF